MTTPTIRQSSGREVLEFFRHAENTLYGGIMQMLFDSDRLAGCDEFFVAEVNGTIIGAVTLAFEGLNGPTLDTVYVWDDYQGRGIGRLLCATAIQRFIEAGKTPIHCQVNSGAMHAIIEHLPDDQQKMFRLNLAYKVYGDLELKPMRLQDLLGEDEA